MTRNIQEHTLVIAYINDLIIDLKLMLAGREPFENLTPDRLNKWEKHRRELERFGSGLQAEHGRDKGGEK